MKPCFVLVTIREPMSGEVSKIYKNMNHITSIVPSDKGCDLWSNGKCTRITETPEVLFSMIDYLYDR